MELKPGHTSIANGGKTNHTITQPPSSGKQRVPENSVEWDVKLLGDVCKITTGSKDVNEGNPNGLLPFFTCSRSITYSDSYSFDAEAILIAGNGDVGTRHYYVGKFEAYQRTYVLSDFQIPTLYVDQYLEQYLIPSLVTDKIGSSIPYIKMENLRTFKVKFPTGTTELQAIVAALSDVDALLAKLDALIAKKRDIKQAAMQQLLTGKQRLPGFRGEWEVKRLGDVVERIIGGGTPSRANPHYWHNGIPWMTVKDFATFNPYQTQESITSLGLKNSATNLIPRGTLIISTRMALGKAVIYKVDVTINQDLKAIFPKRNIFVSYLYYWFEYYAQTIDDLGSGSTVKGISLSELKAIKFHVASKGEQRTIATVLSDMDAELAALETQRDKTRALKQGMMQELLTGRIRLV